MHILATALQLDGLKKPKHVRGLPHTVYHCIYSAVGIDMVTSLTAWNMDNIQIKC